MKQIMLLFFWLASVSIALANESKFYIGDNNNSRIARVNVDGSDFEVIDFNGLALSFYDADVDPINKKIYMAWYYGIYVMNYDGSDLDTIINYPSGGYSSGIAVDAAGGKIYWGSTVQNTIYRANLDGTGITALYTNAMYVGDVDLDLKNGHIYYGSYILTASKGLYRLNINGTGHTTIAAGYDVHFLGLDIKNERIYFSDGGAAKRANLDGSNIQSIFTFQPGGFWVDTTQSVLYTTDMTGNRFISSDLSGGNIQVLEGTNLQSPHGPVFVENACDISISMQPVDVTVAAGDDAVFSVSAIGSINSYQWQQDNGTGYINLSNAGQFSGVNTNTLNISNVNSSQNNYAFRCILSGTVCSDTTEDAKLIVTTTSVFERSTETNLFTVYPNPVDEYFSITTNIKNVPITLTITDVSGRLLIKEKVENFENLRFRFKQPSGIFFIHISTAEGHTETQRIIKL